MANGNIGINFQDLGLFGGGGAGVQTKKTSTDIVSEFMKRNKKKKSNIQNKLFMMQWQKLLDEYNTKFQWERGMGAPDTTTTSDASIQDIEDQEEIEDEAQSGGDLSSLEGVGDVAGTAVDLLTDTFGGGWLDNLFSMTFGSGDDDDDDASWWDASGIFSGW